MNEHKVVVIGGGFSGLATSALLAKKGWSVTLLEKNSDLGGRARVFHKNNFKFDMGPSWYLMPEVFDKFFKIFGFKTSDFYELKRLVPRYDVYFDDKKITLEDSLKSNYELFESLEKGSGGKLKKYLEDRKELYNDITSKLLYKNIFNFKTWFDLDILKVCGKLALRPTLLRSWESDLRKIFSEEILRKILSFPSVFLGGSPFSTPAIYSLLTWSDFGLGVWYPVGGMGKIIEALKSLAEKHGVKILTDKEVTSIKVEEDKVQGVVVGDEFFPASIVVGASDLPHIESLLPEEFRVRTTQFWNKSEIGISGVILYLGINKKLKNISHHSLYFSANWEKNFADLQNNILPNDPSFYFSTRSVSDRSIVPANSEEIFVLIPVGSSLKYDQKKIKELSDSVIEKIETLINEKIRNNIVVKELYSPMNFSEDYNAFRGTALGLSHTLRQSLWLRPSVKSEKVDGLYFAGQWVHPGVGVPMAIISSQIVASEIGDYNDDKKRIFKKGSVTYYYSSLFFKGQTKKDVFTLYAYVRTVDDLVDCENQKIQEFEELYAKSLLVWKNDVEVKGIVGDFIKLAKRKKFKWEWIEAFWKSMRMDVSKKNYSKKELYEYMFGSAEVIGLMMAKILDLPKESYDFAAMQGRAMQFINFIRDIKEDDELGRNYLGIDKKLIDDENYMTNFIREKIDEYHLMQKEAQKGYKYIPKKYLIPIKTASDLYQWTAEKIYENPSVVLQKKVKPSKYYALFRLIKNVFLL